MSTSIAPPRIEYLSVTNYRALRQLTLEKKISPLTVFLGPNGSGKSTIFDVFAFLSECFTIGIRKAWDKRGRFKELRSREAEDPIKFELKYRERARLPLITYHLEINESPRGPFVAAEWMSWKRSGHGRPFKFLDFHNGEGQVITGEMPELEDERIAEKLSSPESLAVNTLGQFTKHPRVGALRNFITGWYLSYLTADNTRGVPEAGPMEKLSITGDNLPNVIQHLREREPQRLNEIIKAMKSRVPRLDSVDAEILADGRLMLQIRDAPFERPIMAKYASDGTLKMLAYLTVLYDPEPSPLVGIEEPENQLHPRLLRGLAEECRNATARSQMMVTTHSPYFVSGLKPEELWVLYRDEKGYTNARRATTFEHVPDMIKEGALLGDLWMEGYLDI